MIFQFNNAAHDTPTICEHARQHTPPGFLRLGQANLTRALARGHVACSRLATQGVAHQTRRQVPERRGVPPCLPVNFPGAAVPGAFFEARNDFP